MPQAILWKAITIWNWDISHALKLKTTMFRADCSVHCFVDSLLCGQAVGREIPTAQPGQFQFMVSIWPLYHDNIEYFLLTDKPHSECWSDTLLEGECELRLAWLGCGNLCSFRETSLWMIPCWWLMKKQQSHKYDQNAITVTGKSLAYTLVRHIPD